VRHEALRVGVGMFTRNTASQVYFQARADLVGVIRSRRER
jgi:hypothetical protein